MAHTFVNDEDDYNPEWYLQCSNCYHNIGGMCSNKSSNWYHKYPRGDEKYPCWKSPDSYCDIDTAQMKLC